MNEQIASTLSAAFSFWSVLSEADRCLLCDNTRAFCYRKGEQVHDNTDCSGVFLVQRGTLRVYVMSEEGREVTLYRLHAGEMCMLSASCVLQSITFDVFIDAEVDTECLLVSAGAFSDVIERCDAAKIFSLELAVERFSDVMWVLQQILFLSMDRRLAIFLLDESARLEHDLIPLTHAEIARAMGSAREVISRTLKYFTAEQLVELSRGGVRLLDKARLKRLAF